MDFITQNPYRVLGVFANAPLKVRTANIAKIRALNKFGKACEFESDFVDLFGKIDRSDEALDNAIDQLANEVEAKCFQLFWLHRTKKDELSHELDTDSICDGAEINKAVLALYNKQYEDAAIAYACIFEKDIYTVRLFDEEMFWRNEEEFDVVSKRFIEYLIKIDNSLEPGIQDYSGFFWQFKQYQLHETFLKSLYEAYRQIAIRRLEQIISPNFIISPISTKYRKVLWISKPSIDIINEYSTCEYFRNQISSYKETKCIFDKFASYLIDFCEKTYQNSKYWHQEDIYDLVFFVEDKIQGFIYQQETSERFHIFYKALIHRARLLTSSKEVIEEVKTIREEIKQFNYRQTEVGNSLTLVNNCVRPLITIKEKLGKDNIYYQYISSMIAEEAIHGCEVELVNVRQKHNSQDDNTEQKQIYMNQVMRQAGILACNLKEYNLEKEFYDNIFIPFYNQIIDLLNKFDVDVNDIKADFPLETDDIIQEKDYEIKKHGFASVAGLHKLKQRLNEEVIDLIRNPEQYKKLRVQIPNGILLYGPPGCGKTFIAEKFAEELGSNYMYVQCSDVASPYIHGGQEKIAAIFKEAREKAPTVLFLDELDAMLARRDRQNNVSQAGEVNEFLTQLNNCAENRVIVIGATNNPQVLDPAALRSGRLDIKVYVPAPNEEERIALLKLELIGRAAVDINYAQLTKMTEGFVSKDVCALVNKAALISAKEGRESINMNAMKEALERSKGELPSVSASVLKQHEQIRDEFEHRKAPSRRQIGFNTGDE